MFLVYVQNIHRPSHSSRLLDVTYNRLIRSHLVLIRFHIANQTIHRLQPKKTIRPFPLIPRF